jgi:ATP/maltotriose-dependent transcriptional regulator MalT
VLASYIHEWTQADLLFRRALELAEQEGYTSVIPLLLLNRADALFQVGELELAREMLGRAEGMAERIQSIHVLALVAQFHAMLARRRGDDVEASGHLARSLLLATRGGLRLERAEALEQLALLHHDAGRVDDAHANLAEASAEFFAAGATRDCARCRDLLAAWAPPPDDAPAGTVPALRIAGAA